MPDDTFTAALKEAYALVPSNVAVLETLSFKHPSIIPIRIVKDRINRLLWIDSVQYTFEAASFALQLPTSNDTGVKELGLAVDNIDHRISDVLESLEASATPMIIEYRAYLENDATTPQNDPPLILEARNFSLDGPICNITAKFVDFANKKFLTFLYTRDRFPSLGG